MTNPPSPPAANPAGTTDLPRIERAVREILAAVGEDPDREGLRETPARVARMYRELFCGLRDDPSLHLRKFFTEQYDEMVLVRDISFNSMCEHHLLPFTGVAHIGYVPNGKVVGLSKLARVVESISHRPQVQERMTEQIANLLIQELDVKGVAVVIEATHSCMTIRGVRKPGSICVTSAMKALFRSNLSRRSEVMNLIYGERKLFSRAARGALFHSKMLLLAQFLLRLAFGLAVGMAITSSRKVMNGFFRNHLYVTLGLTTLAAMVLARLSPIEMWIAIAAAGLSFIGSAAWLYESKQFGKLMLWLVAACSIGT